MDRQPLVDRLDELRLPILKEWLMCPSCKSRDAATVGVDPIDGELTLACTACGYNGILAAGDALEECDSG